MCKKPSLEFMQIPSTVKWAKWPSHAFYLAKERFSLAIKRENAQKALKPFTPEGYHEDKQIEAMVRDFNPSDYDIEVKIGPIDPAILTKKKREFDGIIKELGLEKLCAPKNTRKRKPRTEDQLD